MQPPPTTPRAVPIARAGRGRWIASGLGLALATLAVRSVSGPMPDEPEGCAARIQ